MKSWLATHYFDDDAEFQAGLSQAENVKKKLFVSYFNVIEIAKTLTEIM